MLVVILVVILVTLVTVLVVTLVILVVTLVILASCSQEFECSFITESGTFRLWSADAPPASQGRRRRRRRWPVILLLACPPKTTKSDTSQSPPVAASSACHYPTYSTLDPCHQHGVTNRRVMGEFTLEIQPQF